MSRTSSRACARAYRSRAPRPSTASIRAPSSNWAARRCARRKGGRYAAKPSDNLFRPLVVPVQGGRIEVGVRGSRAASELSKRAIAQREFLATGDDTKLRKLRKTKVLDASGREVPFLTDEDELARQGDLGALSFESIYARRG